MALNINPNIVTTVIKTAASRAVLAAAQHASPAVVRAFQRLFQVGNFLDDVFGTRVEDTPTPLLGGMTPKQAMEKHQQVRDLQPTRKSLFYIRVTDPNPPDAWAQWGETISVTGMFDLLAIDVSYSGNTLTGEKVAIGSSVMDKLTGRDAVELSITTMDDSIGTLKRWFKGKCDQATHEDGTFGLPAEFVVDIEIVHGIPSDDVPNAGAAYKAHFKMRPQSDQHELSRREQGLEEITMVFSQFDSFLKPGI